MKKISIALLLIFTLNSCFDQGDCSDVATNDIVIGFYSTSNRQPKTIPLDSVIVEGSNSVYYTAQSVAKVTLPLNPERETISYRFYSGGLYSVLDVKYKVKSYALAPDCVAIDLFSIDEATGAGINEIFYIQKAISKNATENLRLYF